MTRTPDYRCPKCDTKADAIGSIKVDARFTCWSSGTVVGVTDRGNLVVEWDNTHRHPSPMTGLWMSCLECDHSWRTRKRVGLNR